MHWGPAQKQSVFIPRYVSNLGPNMLPFALSARTDPLVGHGRHFGRTIRTFCRIHTLISNGVSRTMQLELGRLGEDDLPQR